MKFFVLRLFFFLLIGILLGEAIVRVFNLTIDVPRMYVNPENHLIRFFPNQQGNAMGGKHKWVINKYGFHGYEPKSLNSAISIIGDSYISNTMNPPDCHQGVYLSHRLPGYNFFPASRDGATFLEYMELAAFVEDSIKPVCQLVYLQAGDVFESLVENGRDVQKVQISLTSRKIQYATISSSRLKRVLYRFKFFYFLYRSIIVPSIRSEKDEAGPSLEEKKDYSEIEDFIKFVAESYKTDKIYLVFHPGSDPTVIELFRKHNFRVFVLNLGKDKSWSLENDSHWSCYGHEQAAKQVSVFLRKALSENHH